ncbi:MAG: hypothetical protein CMJ46_10625 [Planctomyces sp.]|nr:hypothetical protein [Planctomyces sp.]
MIRQPVTRDTNRASALPGGTTLVEVLMSILLMGIGLVALATMFPASILRTVRAHHLTSATNLRFNAEAFVDLYPLYVEQWDDGTYPSAVPSPGVTTFIAVDPQGNVQAADPTNDFFGNNNIVRRQLFDTTLPIFDFDVDTDAADRDDAVTFTTSYDSWEAVFDSDVVGGTATATQVQLDTDLNIDENIDLTNATPNVQYRAVLFSDTNRGGQYRKITARNDAAKTITWSPAIDAITAGTFTPGRVKVEISDPRFSWMMTVRRTYIDGTQVNNNADMVVFFNRNFPSDAETVYNDASITLGSTDVFLTASAINPKPKVGNFIFDAEHCRWYRIVSVESEEPYLVTIDRPAVQTSGSAMLVRNVIDVFPLNSFITTYTP